MFLDEYKNLVFIAFSDTHGDAEKVARLYTLIEQTLQADREKNPKVQHVLLVPGDVFGVSTIYSTLSKGQFDIDAISKIAELFPIGHRFFTPGNHDFSYGEQALMKLITQAKFQMVISNTKFKQSNLPFQSKAELKIDGKKITLGGLMTPETLHSPEAKKVIAKIGWDIVAPEFEHSPPVITLSHLGSETDKELPYPTYVFGGHTHDRQLGTTKNGHPMVNTGVGECIIVFRSGTKPEILLSEDFSPGKPMQELINQYASQYNLNLERPVFTIASDSIIPSGLELSAEELETSLSHLRVSDSMMVRITADAIASELREKKAENVDFVLYPAAAIRSNFLPGQQVTEKQLFETYYYNNKLVYMCLSGSQVIHLLAVGVMQGYKCWENRGQLLTPSEGLTYAYNILQENPGDTISWVKINNKFIDPEASFHIVTTDWVANEVKKMYPTIEMKEYSNNVDPVNSDFKIFKMVVSYLRDRKNSSQNLFEKFGERIFPEQTLQQQNDLIKKHGYRRSDPPSFDRYSVPINLFLHKKNFLKQKQEQLTQHGIRCIKRLHSGANFFSDQDSSNSSDLISKTENMGSISPQKPAF